MSEQWQDFTSQVGGREARVHVDPEARANPDAARPVRLTVSVGLRTPDAKGLSTPAEDEDLEDLRNVLKKVVDIRVHARFVGTVTTGGRYELVFYGASGDGLAEAVGEAMIDFDEYKAETRHESDPQWTYVRTAMSPT